MVKKNILIEYFQEKKTSLEYKLKKLNDLEINYKRNGDLLILKYVSESEPIKEIQKICNGVIIDINLIKIVCLPITKSIKIHNFRNAVPFNRCVIEENIEGSLINLYYYKNRWNVSSKFSINADQSKFLSDKTFRQIFDSLINVNNIKLNTNYTYSFVMNGFNSSIYHIESTNNITGDNINLDLGIKKPKVLYIDNRLNELNLNNYDDIEKVATSLPHNKKGLMIYSTDRLMRASILSDKYVYKRNLIKNQGDILYVCLISLYYDNNKDLILEYYPHFKEKFLEVESKFNNLLNKLFNIYIEVKCKKIVTEIPKLYEKPIRNIHQIYKGRLSIRNTKNSSKITKKDVYLYLKSLNSKYLYTLVNNYQL